MNRYALTSKIQDVLIDGIKPAKDIAKAIGKPYSTMLREANPYDVSAKIGAETMFDIMRATGDVRPLRYMAEQLGYELTPKDRGRDSSNFGKASDSLVASV